MIFGAEGTQALPPRSPRAPRCRPAAGPESGAESGGGIAGLE